jgi:hypothetical protein
MADYKELLRRAVEALPENNGAARRAVYEKARAALVGQLRAIHPPLPARDITTHRLQLEDCIRQVEQESSEAVIAGMGNHGANDAPPPPVYFEPPGRAPAALAKPQTAPAKAPTAKPMLVAKEAPKSLPAGGTIEDIIAAANAEAPLDAPAPRKKSTKFEPKGKGVPIRLASPPPPAPKAVPEEDEDIAEEADILPPRPAAKPGNRTLPAIVARAEAAKTRSASTAFSVPGGDKPYDSPRRGPTIEPRPSMMPAARGGQAAFARQPVVEPVAFLSEPKVVAAMSAVREVEVEAQRDPQGAIDRAIATLDREARGEATPDYEGVANDHDEELTNGRARGGLGGMLNGSKNKVSAGRAALRQQPALLPPPAAGPARDKGPAPRHGRDKGNMSEATFPRARAEQDRGGLGAVTIFVIVFAVLLAGVGGAGVWAYSAGYLDLSTMFRPSETASTAAPNATAPVATANAAVPATGPGNTAAPAEAAAPATELAGDARLASAPTSAGTELALVPMPTAATEERLSAEGNGATTGSAEAAVASIDPTAAAGSQSLLLEASDDGTTGAVPFSGSVDWSKGTDEMGQPTLVGKASIPARNLGVDVLIRKNSDPSLPASHLMEVNFKVTDSFIGGSVAGLPGVLLKNEELVQGTPLVGASARVVGNSFLFALSASQADVTTNAALLVERKWIDLALVYATGKRAIITLEKDAAADGLFKEVFSAWGQTASN